ncbi:MAG: PAS domain S-box protein [bacterium]
MRQDATPDLGDAPAYPRWLAEAIQMAPVGVFVTDADGEQLFANRRWSELTGVSSQAACGRGWLAAIHPNQRARVSGFWFDHVRDGKTVDSDFRVTLTDGTTRWAHCFAVPIFRPDGSRVGFVGMLADISERREVARAYRTLVEHSLQGYVVYQDTRPVFVNSAFTEITGYTLAEILAAGDWHQVGTMHADDRDRVIEHSARFLVGEPVSPRLEMRNIRKDGAERWLELFMSRIEYHHRPALQVVYIDVTERHQLEAGLQHLNTELERRVQERTAQLEGTLRELEAFSYSVSHDLRAPLRAIDGFSQALLEDYEPILDARGRDYLERVRRATHHMGDLIDDLLTLARVMRDDLTREPIDLTALVCMVVDELQRAAPQHAPTLVIAKGIRASGDRALLRTVLANLLGNAWKFTGPCAAPRIEFGVLAGVEPAVFFVRDNGVGFDMAYADKLFGPFSRLHSAEEFEGTGIGLATVQRIIARHGGRVWGEAALERGATFYFTLGG